MKECSPQPTLPQRLLLCLAPLFRSTPQMANVNPLISTLFEVVTPHCTFRNAAGSAVVVTTWMVLRRSPSMEEFVNAFKEAVLPLACVQLVKDRSDLRFKQKIFPLSRHCGKDTRTKLYRQKCRSF